MASQPHGLQEAFWEEPWAPQAPKVSEKISAERNQKCQTKKAGDGRSNHGGAKQKDSGDYRYEIEHSTLSRLNRRRGRELSPHHLLSHLPVLVVGIADLWIREEATMSRYHLSIKISRLLHASRLRAAAR